MKPKATYKCGHESTREFDRRNRLNRGIADSWPREAAKIYCPACRRNRIDSKIDNMNEAQLRDILHQLSSVIRVAEAIEAVHK